MGITEREKIAIGLEKCERCKCDDCTENGASHFPWDCPAYDDFVDSAIALLKEQPEIVRCKDCKNWIAGYITGQDEFIPPKCGKYKQMVGHSSDDFCSLAERRETNG